VTPRFRLLTNHPSNTFLALRRAARSMGGEVRALTEIQSVEELEHWNAHGAIVFLYGWPETAAATVELLRELRIPVAVWQVDDPHFFSDPKLHDVTLRVARRADLYFSHTRQLDQDYAKLGVRVHYLPTSAKVFPGVEELIRPPLPDEACERDWSFVGTLSDARCAFLDALKMQLPAHLRGTIHTGIPSLEALRIYRSSRVLVGFGTASEGATVPSLALTERTWDVPLVGGFLLQDDRPYLGEHFTLGEEVVTFSHVEDCARKIAYYCQNADARRAMAARAQARVLREHLTEHRLEVILARLRALAASERPTLGVGQAAELSVPQRAGEERTEGGGRKEQRWRAP
jgi:Glycosyl transferases group 1